MKQENETESTLPPALIDIRQEVSLLSQKLLQGGDDTDKNIMVFEYLCLIIIEYKIFNYENLEYYIPYELSHIEFTDEQESKLKFLINQNKIFTKQSLNIKWSESSDIKAQNNIYKLIATQKERDIINSKPKTQKDKKKETFAIKLFINEEDEEG